MLRIPEPRNASIARVVVVTVMTMVITTTACVLVSVPALAAPIYRDAPSAPVPPQIMAAKSVFISNAGGTDNLRFGGSGFYSGSPDRPYNEFYDAMKRWGRYQLVSSPAGADLIFEIRLMDRTVEATVMKGSSVGKTDDPQVRLVILDPKTHVVLWAFTEHAQLAFLQGNRDRNLDQAIARLVDDLKNLAGPASAGIGK